MWDIAALLRRAFFQFFFGFFSSVSDGFADILNVLAGAGHSVASS